MIDWKAEIPLRHQSIPILRQQQDTSESPGEQSINPEGLWRRIGESWHFGAGQDRYDRKDSNKHRFRASKGFDVWEQWQLTLLPTTIQSFSNSAAEQHLAVAGDYLYVAYGNNIRHTQDPTTFGSALTGVPGNAASSITSNGYHVWTAHGTNGVYRTARGTTATASIITGTVSLVAYVKSRVMCAYNNILYDASVQAVAGVAAALPVALFTHGNVDFKWIGFAESQSHIYAAGYSGGRSLIYSITVKDDGSAMDQPILAGQLPEGEIVTSIYGYLGRFLAIGTSKGFRLAVVSEGGGLTIGALVETSSPVLCFEGQEEFIWYGNSNNPAFWTDDEPTSGLGRMSTATFSDVNALIPAYATDIYTDDSTNSVSSVVTFADKRVFSIAGRGVYTQSPNTVSKGYLKTGGISYGISDYKTAIYLDITLSSTYEGTMQPYLITDEASIDNLGARSTERILTTWGLGEKVGRGFELVITNEVVDTTIPHPILAWMFQVQPRPQLTNLIFATVILAPAVESLTDTWLDYDTVRELNYIENLSSGKELVIWQENDQTYTVIVDDYEVNFFSLINETDGTAGFNSSCTLKLKRV